MKHIYQPYSVALLLVVGAIVQVRSLEHIVYGEPIYIESGGRARGTVWLSGSRSADDQYGREVVALNALAEDQLSSRETFRWKILSAPGTGVLSDGSEDELRGECVRFGDVVYILNLSDDEKWLSGSRTGGNEVVTTLNLKDQAQLRAADTYKWTILSSHGTGGLGEAGKNDLGYGQCIYDISAVFLQNEYQINRWITGDRGGVGSVYTRNIFDDSGATGSYQWVLSRELAIPGSQQPIRCAASSSSGSWFPGSYTNGGHEVEYFIGVDRTSSSSFTQTSSWEATVTASVTAGFSVFGAGASASLSVSGSYGESMERSVTEAVSYQTQERRLFTFDQPGRVWQWQYSVRDICQSSPWSLKTKDIVVTNSNAERPCCLPGFAADPKVQHGRCLADSPCICSPEDCEAINRDDEVPNLVTESPSPAPVAPPVTSGTTDIQNQASDAQELTAYTAVSFLLLLATVFAL